MEFELGFSVRHALLQLFPAIMRCLLNSAPRDSNSEDLRERCLGHSRETGQTSNRADTNRPLFDRLRAGANALSQSSVSESPLGIDAYLTTPAIASIASTLEPWHLAPILSERRSAGRRRRRAGPRTPGFLDARRVLLATRPDGLATTPTASRAKCVWVLGPMGGRIRDD
jgi:hypothetical protein